MPRHARVTENGLIDAAVSIVETTGSRDLTINALADALHVKPPSLYNHVTGIEDVRTQVRVVAAARLGDVLIEAAMGRAGEDALFALCHAYRGFALANPELYAMTIGGRAGQDDDLDRTAWRALRPLFAVLTAQGFDETDATHTARTIRAALHGFVSLEINGGFGLPESTDASFDRLVELLLSSIDKDAEK